MSSFKHFLNSSEDSSESVNSRELQTSLAMNISGILASATFSVSILPGFPSFFFKNTEEEKVKFSEEVANYVTSDEFISSLRIVD